MEIICFGQNLAQTNATASIKDQSLKKWVKQSLKHWSNCNKIPHYRATLNQWRGIPSAHHFRGLLKEEKGGKNVQYPWKWGSVLQVHEHWARFDQVKCVKIRTILCIDSAQAEHRCALWTVAVTQRSADSLCELCSAAHVPARLSGLMGLDREGVYDTDIYIARGSTGKAAAALLCPAVRLQGKEERIALGV